MKYYKDKNNQVWAFVADGSQDAFIPIHLVAITKEEADTIRFPSPSLKEIQSRINEEALFYLNSTDWYVVRFVETGVSIPIEILTARQNARESIK